MVDLTKNLDPSEELEALVAITKLKGLSRKKVPGKKYAPQKLDSQPTQGGLSTDELILQRLAGMR